MSSSNNSKAFVVLSLFLVIIAFLFFGPVFTIWSLNTLFGLQIPVSFQTWCAVVWLLTALHGIRISLNRDS